MTALLALTCELAAATAAAPTRPRSAGELGGLSVRVVQAPTVIDPRRGDVLRYEVELATGDATERFSVLVEPPLFGDGGAALVPTSGAAAWLEGPAQPVGGAEIFSHASCSPSPGHDVHHGAEAQRTQLRIVAPPHTSSTLVATFTSDARDAPFADMPLRPSFAFDRGQLTIAPVAPRVRGPRGVRIVLATDPGTAFFNPLHAPRVDDGALVRVRGRTVPRLRAQMIRLTELSPDGRGALRLVARARTDVHGRFRARWRPRGTGLHQLFATYRRQRRGLTDDRACPAFVRVRG